MLARSCIALGFAQPNFPRTIGRTTLPTPVVPPPKYKGLNDRGREVVREMNRLGMVINVSHSSDETIAQTVDVEHDAARGNASRAAG